MADLDPERVAEQVRERLKELRGQELTNAEVDAEVRRFLAAGPPALPVLLEQFLEDDEALLAVATQTLKAWEEPRPIKPLIRLLQSRDVSDLAKGLILIVLEKYGLDVDSPEVFAVGINLEEYPLGASGGGNGGTHR